MSRIRASLETQVATLGTRVGLSFETYADTCRGSGMHRNAINHSTFPGHQNLRAETPSADERTGGHTRTVTTTT
jgi:hypothetical protein